MTEAIRRDDAQFIKELLDRGLPMDPFYALEAVKVKGKDALEAFLQNGWNINQPMSELKPPILGYAIADEEMTVWLLDHGAPSYPDAQNLIAISLRQKLKFTYDTRLKSFRALMTMRIHARGSTCFGDCVNEIRNLKLFDKIAIATAAEGRIKDFAGRYKDSKRNLTPRSRSVTLFYPPSPLRLAIPKPGG